jgi:ribokinase
MGRKVLAVVGSLGYDMIMRTNRVPDAGESLKAIDYYEAMGGKGSNAAVAAYRCSRPKPTAATDGTTEAVSDDTEINDKSPPPKKTEENDIYVTMVGAVGDDDYGKIMVESLTKNGVDTQGVITFPGYPSAVCFIMVESFSGENRCLFNEGAMRAWQRSHFLKVADLAHGLKPDLLLVQMEIRKEVVEQAIETAGEAKIDVILNAAPADPITARTYPYLTHLVINETEAAILSGRELDEVTQESWPVICKEFLQRGAKNVIITVGEQGAFFATATDSGLIPAYKVNVVDTTGAG